MAETFEIGDQVSWHPNRHDHVAGDSPNVRREVGGSTFEVINVFPADEDLAKHPQWLNLKSGGGATIRRISGYYFTLQDRQRPVPEPTPAQPAGRAPTVHDACSVLAGYVNSTSMVAAGYHDSSSIGPGRVNEVLSACQWLQAQHPARAAEEVRRWEDMRVAQLCDAEHLAHLIEAKERAVSREVARACQDVIDMLVDAGAPRPERGVCGMHGGAVSA